MMENKYAVVGTITRWVLAKYPTSQEANERMNLINSGKDPYECGQAVVVETSLPVGRVVSDIGVNDERDRN